jgi:hypothetical protein
LQPKDALTSYDSGKCRSAYLTLCRSAGYGQARLRSMSTVMSKTKEQVQNPNFHHCHCCFPILCKWRLHSVHLMLLSTMQCTFNVAAHNAVYI